MTHTAIEDLTAQVTVQPGAVVSKVVYRDADLDVTVFAFDAGQGLTEHTATRPALVQVLDGRLRLTVDGQDVDMGPGAWVHMEAGAPHALLAQEPTVLLLTLLRPVS
ncbi:MAG TPA: cupin domain-containing protein [Actinomycetota bacterium]|jgi:quercetin dioxygenase-like cupin family protein|nr:cupin domain-containing protein [Actinomycetota bacterium]